jgi:hypothetical protein
MTDVTPRGAPAPTTGCVWLEDAARSSHPTNPAVRRQLMADLSLRKLCFLSTNVAGELF